MGSRKMMSGTSSYLILADEEVARDASCPRCAIPLQNSIIRSVWPYRLALDCTVLELNSKLL